VIDARSRFAVSIERAGTTGVAMAVCFLLLLFGLLGARQAQAFEIHKLDSAFPATGLGAPTTVAVDEATGNVYVLDLFSGNIAKFDAAGTHVNLSALGSHLLPAACTNLCNQLAVDNSGGPNQGVIYVSNNINEQSSPNRKLLVYLPSGKAAEGLRNQLEPYPEVKSCGVATDRNEHVYVAHDRGMEPGSYTPPPRNFSAAHIQRFKPGAWLPAGVSPTPQTWPYTGTMFGLPLSGNGAARDCRIASSSDGDQYYSEYEAGIGGLLTKVAVYRAPREYFNNLPGPDVTTVDEGSTYFAVDQSNDDVYFDQESVIVRRNEAGQTLERFGSIGFSLGVAVNSLTGTVYATDAFSGEVLIFETTEAPDVSYDPETVGATTADISGTVGTAGAGDVTDCKVEWGLTTAYASPPVQCTPDAAGTPFSAASTPVTASLSGLSQETTYHYRISATNVNGTTQGLDRTFTTHNVSDLSTDPATDITTTTATLNGSWTNTAGNVEYKFEWGPTTSYGSEVTGSSSATGVVKVSAPITGLVADTPDIEQLSPGLYHYRITATGPAGTTVGADRTFTTDPPDPPSISEVGASGLSTGGVTLSAMVNPNLGSTIYLFEYGRTTAYGSNTPTVLVDDDDTDHPVSQGIAGLAPGTTYHFRAVASNFGGTTLGADQVFTTPSLPAPETPFPTNPGTQQNSNSGSGGGEATTPPKKCKKGFVKKRGKCVKKKKKKKKKKKNHKRTSRSHG
jgi:hypothetical protein